MAFRFLTKHRDGCFPLPAEDFLLDETVSLNIFDDPQFGSAHVPSIVKALDFAGSTFVKLSLVADAAFLPLPVLSQYPHTLKTSSNSTRPW